MRIKRLLTYILYKLETLSTGSLVLVILAFFITSTLILLVTLKPRKILRVVYQSDGISNNPKSRNLRHLALQYEKSNVSRLLATSFQVEFDVDVLVYNRVPKCASIYLTRLFHKIGSQEPKYKVTSPYIQGEHPWMTEEHLRSHAHWISNLDEEEKPLVYIRHEYFVDFERWGAARQPLYVNMIRDPIERFTSFFYFIRFGNKEGDGADQYLTDDERRRMTLDECVQLRAKECTNPKWQMIPYFCGQEPVCRKRSEEALEKAKENIEKYYAVVGIVEELEISAQVFEKMLPRYFDGASGLVNDPSALARNDTLTLGKKQPSEQTRKFLKYSTSIRLEYELYEFAKERLFKFHKLLELKN